MTKLTAGDAGAKAEIADADRVVLEGVCEVVVSLGHGSDKDADALVVIEALNVVAHPYHRSFEAEGDLSTVRR